MEAPPTTHRTWRIHRWFPSATGHAHRLDPIWEDTEHIIMLTILILWLIRVCRSKYPFQSKILHGKHYNISHLKSISYHVIVYQNQKHFYRQVCTQKKNLSQCHVAKKPSGTETEYMVFGVYIIYTSLSIYTYMLKICKMQVCAKGFYSEILARHYPLTRQLQNSSNDLSMWPLSFLYFLPYLQL